MNGKKLVKGTILTAFGMAAMLCAGSTTGRAYWVEVKSDETRVRDAASTDSDVMTAVNAGDKLDVVSEEQDGEGNTWYKVSINNVSGYVRSDTVQETSEPDTDQAEAAAVLPTVTSAVEPVAASSSSVVEPMATQAATVKDDNVNVRASASTGANVVAKLQKGAAVTLTGTASDSSGKTWYQVNFINNGSNVTGFIREDFVEPGEVMESQTPEEETLENDGDSADMYGDMSAEDEMVNNDYELFYELDTEGEDYYWYIHDNIAQKRYKLEQLMNADEMNANNMAIKDKEIKRLKIIMIVLAALLVIALVAAGIFGYKYLNAGYDDDDEDDEDIRAEAARRRAQAEAAGRRREADREEGRSAGAVRRTDAGVQRRPAAAQRRTEGENTRIRSTQPVRTREGAEAQRRSASGTARTRSAQSAEAVRARREQSDGEERARRPQSAPQVRRPQSASENDAVRKSSRTDVEWRSKNFLAGDEDGLDFSFINGNDETFPE